MNHTTAALSPVPTNRSLREFLLDHPGFNQYDYYYAEYTLREGVTQFCVLLHELLGEQPRVVLGNTGQDNTPAGRVQFIIPANTALLTAIDREENPPLMMLSDTLLAHILFTEQGRPNTVFDVLYHIALTHDLEAFVGVFRELMASHELGRELGQAIHSLYGQSDQLPDKATLQNTSQSIMQRLEQFNQPAGMNPTASPASLDLPNVCAPKDTRKPFNPEQLN